MGLFDSFYFKSYKLKKSMFPNGLGELDLNEMQNADYQTKDLGETFTGHFYLKKKDGAYRLYKHDIEYKWIDGNKKAKSVMDRIGHMEEISSKEILIDDIGTNTINVYTHFAKENHDYWVEFALVFLENELLKVEVHEFREDKNDERKVRDLEIREMIKKSADFHNSFQGKLQRIYYKSLLRVQFIIGNFFVRLGEKIKIWRLL